MSKATELMSFPSVFPVKVFGKTSDGFNDLVMDIFNKHVPNISENEVNVRSSKDNNYVSITLKTTFTSKKQINGLYMELTGNKNILFAL